MFRTANEWLASSKVGFPLHTYRQSVLMFAKNPKLYHSITFNVYQLRLLYNWNSNKKKFIFNKCQYFKKENKKMGKIFKEYFVYLIRRKRWIGSLRISEV